MEFLEIPFEPISFRFYSLPASSAGGSLLTWIAVLAAAAVGFWRIRTVGSKSDDGSVTSSLFTSPLEEKQQKAVPLVESTENKVEVSPSCSVNRQADIVGMPKVRFTTYFEKEDCIGSCHVEDEEEELTVDGGAFEELVCREVELPWEREQEVKWEGMVIKRRGDLGWYSYQDMAALNGSVVKLWNGDNPSRRKGVIAISSF